MPNSTTAPTVTADTDFCQRATDAVGGLRSAIADMFSGVPGGVRKSYDVNKLLGVDARLSWQVFKLTGPGDALSLAPHVPLPAAMRRLLAAASKHGISADRVSGVRRAFDGFEQFVAQHAGDRSIFDTMTRGLSDDEASQQTDIVHRKAIFKGHRHYLGTELETHISTVINYPSSEPGTVDIGNLRGKFGMRRLRSDSEMIVDGSKLWNAGEPASQSRDPFDPCAVQQRGAELIPQFCTQPVPALKFKEGANGHGITTLGGEVIGRQGAVDLVFGNTWRNIPLFSPGRDGAPGFGLHLYMNCPTIRLYIDVLVPRSLFATLTPKVEVYGFAPVLGDIEEIKRTQPQLPFKEKAVRLSGGVNGAQIREVPEYLHMVKTFCERMNWNTDELEVFRLFVEYPIMGSLLSFRLNKTSV